MLYFLGGSLTDLIQLGLKVLLASRKLELIDLVLDGLQSLSDILVLDVLGDALPGS